MSALVPIRRKLRGAIQATDAEANWDRLQDREPAAKESYLRAVERGFIPYHWQRFHKLMLELAVEHPEMTRSECWGQMKAEWPKVIWGFVLTYDETAD